MLYGKSYFKGLDWLDDDLLAHIVEVDVAIVYANDRRTK